MMTHRIPTRDNPHRCHCCKKPCWPMWQWLGDHVYCNNCAGIGCHVEPAACQRPLLDRIADKVHDALTDNSNRRGRP